MKGSFERLRLTDCNSRFHRRITEIAWHPKEPYFVGAACKGGDLLLLKGSYDRGDGDLKFTQKLGLKGVMNSFINYKVFLSFSSML